LKKNESKLTNESILIFNDIKKRVDSGEETDPKILEALDLLGVASYVMNSIMAGSQIDPAFFKVLNNTTKNRMFDSKNIKESKKLKKVRKFRQKNRD
jgi:hypothetical protein